MTDCDRLSDRMPDVALGRARWTPDEERHLARCAACREEWELITAAGRLGDRLGTAVEPSALADRVLERVRNEPGEALTPRRSLRRWAAGLAAAAALAGALRLSLPGGSSALPETTAIAAESLTTAQVDSLLDVPDLPLAGWSMLEAPTLGDLDANELEQVLRTWEG